MVEGLLLQWPDSKRLVPNVERSNEGLKLQQDMQFKIKWGRLPWPMARHSTGAFLTDKYLSFIASAKPLSNAGLSNERPA